LTLLCAIYLPTWNYFYLSLKTLRFNLTALIS
jgi:hypothetical protein